MESNILKMIADHEKAIYSETGIMKQLESIRIRMADYVSRKAVFTTTISLTALAVVVGAYMFGLDKRIVRIEEQFKAVNEKQEKQVDLSKDMLDVLNAILKELNREKKGG